MSKYFTTQEAAKLFDVSPRTIRRWVEAKELIPDKFGEHGGSNPHRFSGKTLRDYVLKREGGAGDFLPPSDQLAIARTEEVKLKNEQVKGHLINKDEFVSEYYDRLARVTDSLSQLPDEILMLEKPNRRDIEALINRAIAHAYESAIQDD